MKIKSFLNLGVKKCVANEVLWPLINSTLVRTGKRLQWERTQSERQKLVDLDNELRIISPELTVLHGPFKGMRYPMGKALGSRLLPKILGCYERELADIIGLVITKGYTEIVDIGCAEGYYAVGLALKIPGSRVFAYDVDQAAVKQCLEMASLNGVGDFVSVGGLCDPEVLVSLPLTKKALIISDCEGYEKTLFSREVVSALRAHDFLIEVHDDADIETSKFLREAFEPTHSIQVMTSVDDLQKVYEYQLDELAPYNYKQRHLMLAESRRTTMHWFYAVPKIR